VPLKINMNGVFKETASINAVGSVDDVP